MWGTSTVGSGVHNRLLVLVSVQLRACACSTDHHHSTNRSTDAPNTTQHSRIQDGLCIYSSNEFYVFPFAVFNLWPGHVFAGEGIT